MGLLWTSDSTHQWLNKDEKIPALAGIFLFAAVERKTLFYALVCASNDLAIVVGLLVRVLLVVQRDNPKLTGLSNVVTFLCHTGN